MLIFGTRTSHIARVMHIVVLSVVTMVTYINLSCYIRSVSAHTPQNNVKYTGGSGDKQTTSITLSISSFDNEPWWASIIAATSSS